MKSLFSFITPVVGTTLILLSLSGCDMEPDMEIGSTPSKIVVEGWIENGMNAQVILSLSAPYFSDIDSSSLMDYAVTHAKVTLFSGSQKEILTLTPNEAYFPPFVYKSVDMTGESGKTYSIEVILNGDTITGITTIPEAVMPDSVWFEPEPGKENAGKNMGQIINQAEVENYYRVLYKRKGKDKRFLPGNFSTFSDILFNGRTVEMGFLRGFSGILAADEENFFSAGDTVNIKFCSIDREQFDFWNGYQNEVLAAANPLATSNHHLKSNITGGLGIWTGYGATYNLVNGKSIPGGISGQ